FFVSSAREHFSRSDVEVWRTAFSGKPARCKSAKRLTAAAAAVQSRQSRTAMRAITVLPRTPHSARLEDVAEPAGSDGSVLVRSLALGGGGTDREILNCSYWFAPSGQQGLILGHESLGAVEAAPNGCGLAPGDLVVGIVRRPDPEPCIACAVGEWDMCRNGRYTERGIKERHGYGAEYFRIEPECGVTINTIMEVHYVLLC